MANVSKLFYSIIYADDTTLKSILSSFKRDLPIVCNINFKLAKISHWLKVNKLSLNIKKYDFP